MEAAIGHRIGAEQLGTAHFELYRFWLTTVPFASVVKIAPDTPAATAADCSASREKVIMTKLIDIFDFN